MPRKHLSRRHRGGNAPNPSSYSSATTYQMAANGPANSQFDRVFDQRGPDGSSQSNAIIGLQGQRAGKRGRSRSKRGGFWGSIINQAIVPFTILGLQQSYRKKGGKHTRKLKGGKRSRRHH